MKVDAPLLVTDLAAVPERARRVEELGYDAVFTFEGPHEPFLPLVLAAEHSERLQVATSVAIAFARNPMTVANLAHDLQTFSGGRLLLGLGSQVRAHVERRYSQTWSRPAARMREFVQALRAIWACWNEGEPLRFEGEFYRHTLMPPLFNPGPTGHGPPAVYVGGVGPRMTAVAGEVADGMLVHPFHTEAFVAERTLPALAEGRARAGRSAEELVLACQTLVVTGSTEADYESARELTRQQIAFYASTPAYVGVLEVEGCPELQPELQRLTREGRWAEMGERVDDALLERVAVCGEPAAIPAKLRARYGGVAGRLAFASPYPLDDHAERVILAGLRREGG